MNSSGMNQNSTPITTHTAFNDVLNLIESAKQRAYRAANTELIDLYWAIGQYVSHKINTEGWGKNTCSPCGIFCT